MLRCNHQQVCDVQVSTTCFFRLCLNLSCPAYILIFVQFYLVMQCKRVRTMSETIKADILKPLWVKRTSDLTGWPSNFHDNLIQYVLTASFSSTYERCMIDYTISNFWSESITMLTSQPSRSTSTACTTIRTESWASTNDRFQRWKPLIHTSCRKSMRCLQHYDELNVVMVFLWTDTVYQIFCQETSFFQPYRSVDQGSLSPEIQRPHSLSMNKTRLAESSLSWTYERCMIDHISTTDSEAGCWSDLGSDDVLWHCMWCFRYYVVYFFRGILNVDRPLSKRDQNDVDQFWLNLQKQQF